MTASGAGRLRGLAILGGVAAGLLVLVSVFGVLFTVDVPASRAPGFGVQLTPWDVETVADDDSPADVVVTSMLVAPATGYPLVFSSIVLLGAAVLSATVRSTAGARLAGLVTAAGAAFLVGVACSVGLTVSRFVAVSAPRPLDEWGVELSAGTGLSLLGAAVVLAIGAAVAAFLRGREETDLATPPMGFAVPVRAPLAGPATTGVEPTAGSESADRPNDGP